MWHEGVKIVGSEGSAFLDSESFYPCTHAISILASKDFIGALAKDKAILKAGGCGGCVVVLEAEWPSKIKERDIAGVELERSYTIVI